MPQLIFRGIRESEVRALSQNLCEKLAKTMKTEPDWFVFEHIERKSFCNGHDVVDVFVDVLWFDRGQEIQDNVAKDITEYMKKIGYKEITVIFHSLQKHSYYENGEHY